MGTQQELVLQARLGIDFKDPQLLRRALTHRSFVFERPLEADESNERLEFLGDAFLGMVIGHELFRRFPREQEGRLTVMRSRFVRTETLAEIAADLGLGAALYLGRGEETTGGRCRPRNLARVLEAVIGAVFLDQGYRAARGFVVGLLKGRMDTLSSERLSNYKSLLQEAVQAAGSPPPTYTVSTAPDQHERGSFVVEVRVGVEVLGEGRGTTKLVAEQGAAKAAYQRLAADKRDGAGKVKS